ncbi:DUF1641 domain-containing protein [Geoglobus acetivorans]|uniref:DUF1641 domain-containing protein n=1 Tax=Geoglobus acetivorans TaxID=565033 RepID=A0A0A7GFV4_GEOAI|nr:hypothetical protein GACE_1697 [Geoglobus acetivorans]
MGDEAIVNATVLLAEKLSKDEEKLSEVVSKIVELVESGNASRLLELAGTLAPLIETAGVFFDKETEEVVQNLIETLGAVALSIDSNTIRVVEAMVDALNASTEFTPVTLTGLIRAMRDENVQKTLGFCIKFAQEFGKRL